LGFYSLFEIVLLILSVSQLSLERGLRSLVSALSFSLHSGDVLRISGANGAGKSSLLKVLAGISSDYSGEIQFDGKPMREAELEYREQMLYLGHANAVKTALSPYENLKWFAALYPVKSQVSIDAALQQVGLLAFKNQPCFQLSAGQKQRVALARLLLSKAKLWILDEPFTAIDKTGVAEFEALISRFAENGGAVLITTHHDLAITGNYQQLVLGE
jgi:heme exporter protein A